jgi:hypothetical protein
MKTTIIMPASKKASAASNFISTGDGSEHKKEYNCVYSSSSSSERETHNDNDKDGGGWSDKENRSFIEFLFLFEVYYRRYDAAAAATR